MEGKTTVPADGRDMMDVAGGVMPSSASTTAPSGGGDMPFSSGMNALFAGWSADGAGAEGGDDVGGGTEGGGGVGSGMADLMGMSADHAPGPAAEHKIVLDDDERGTLEMLQELDDEESGAIAGYFVEELLGTGAFARVFVGRDPKTWKKVAIKQVLRVPNFASGPVHEYAMVRRLKYEHIVEAYDCVTDGGEQFIIFEMAEGGDLYDRLEVVGEDGLTRENCRRYLREAAQAIDYCHKKDIVHGDVKLENMLLHQGKIKLCDFGLAGQKDEMRFGRPYGTSAYMAPELVSIRSKTARYQVHPTQDVWGMGIVIYAVLFNDLPWEKALMTDPDYREVEEHGGVMSSVGNFGLLSAAMQTLLAEMLCSDYQRRCPISELVEFLAEPRAWFVSEEAGMETSVDGGGGGADSGEPSSPRQKPTEAMDIVPGSGWRKMSSTIPEDGNSITGSWDNHRTVSPGLLARSRHGERRRSSSMSQLSTLITKAQKGDYSASSTTSDLKLGFANMKQTMKDPAQRPRSGSF